MFLSQTDLAAGSCESVSMMADCLDHMFLPLSPRVNSFRTAIVY